MLNLLELAQDMVAIQSVSQDSNAEVSDLLEGVFDGAGFAVERLEYTDDAGELKVNLIAKKGEGAGGLAFCSHSDTVPGQEQDWEAFNPMIKEGRLYGRGSCDMKGPLAATIMAANSVAASQLKKPVYIVVTADEEVAGYGARHIIHDSKMLTEDKPDFGVIAEPTRLTPIYAHKGYVQILVTAHGKAAHTSTGLGSSANFVIAPFLAEMTKLAAQFKSDPSFLNHEFSPPDNTFNMSINDGDTPINVTAPKSVCKLGFRPMPHARTDDILAMITEQAEKHGLEIRTDRLDALYVSPEAEIVQAALQATGAAKAETVPYGTDGFFLKEVMDLVVLGPGDIAVAHTVGESIAVAELEQAVDIYTRMIERLCM